jgi:hypothetical protein
MFAFDPNVSGQLQTSRIGAITISIPWQAGLKPGPAGRHSRAPSAEASPVSSNV